MARTGQWNPTSREKRARCGALAIAVRRSVARTSVRSQLPWTEHPSCFDQDLLTGTCCSRPCFFGLPYHWQHRRRRRRLSLPRCRALRRSGVVVDVKSGRPVGGGEGSRSDDERQHAGLHPQAAVSGCRSRAARSATARPPSFAGAICTSATEAGNGTWPARIRRVTSPSPRKRRSPTPATATSPSLPTAFRRRRPRPSSNTTVWRHASLPQSREQKELLVLGVAGISVSPAQMASPIASWRWNSTMATAPAVREGLKDSVSYGMAHNAAVPGMEIAGKTGTARWGRRPEPWLVCRHRLPGPRGSGDRDLPPARQRSRCRPAGAALLSCRKSACAGERSLT